MSKDTVAAQGDETVRHNGTKHVTGEGSLSAIEQLAEVVLRQLDRMKANEPAAKVTTVRTLGEKAVDTGLLTGAIVVGGTAVCAIGKFVFGIGRAPKAAPITPMS